MNGLDRSQRAACSIIRAYSVIHDVALAEADTQRFFGVSVPSVQKMG
jgi:hypothetical protein